LPCTHYCILYSHGLGSWYNTHHSHKTTSYWNWHTGKTFYMFIFLGQYNVAENIDVQCTIHTRRSDLIVNHKFECCVELVVDLLKTSLCYSNISASVFFKTDWLLYLRIQICSRFSFWISWFCRWNMWVCIPSLAHIRVGKLQGSLIF
jgi:hypothetical protein